MKNIFLVRHAKAEEAGIGEKDFNRNLHHLGAMDAPRMGQLISEYELKPQILISSPALRAIQTAQFFAEQLKFEISEILLNEDIYEASARTLLNTINNLNDGFETVMMFGHNPGFSYISEYITDEIVGDLPTCGVILISFEIDSWKEVSKGNGTIVKIWNPLFEQE